MSTLNNEDFKIIETQTEDVEELIVLDNPYTEAELKNLINSEDIEGVEDFVDREPVPML
jgi:hypothetical protein